MLNVAVQAQIQQLTRLPRPTIFGTWRVVGVDQRMLKRPIADFNVDHFETTSYLPVGTTFSMELDQPWGTSEPARMSVFFRVLAPIPADACPGRPFANPSDIFLYPLCTRDARPWSDGMIFPDSYVELLRIRETDGDEIDEAQYLYELGYTPADLYFWMGGKNTMQMGFIPYGRDTLLLFNRYMEFPDLDVNDPRQNFDFVLLVAERVE